MKHLTGLLIPLVCCAFVLHADSLVFDRGLPTANLNNAAGADRSNVAWADYSPSGGQNWAIGDTFSLTQYTQITDLRVWIIGTGSEPLSNMWSDLTLFVGGQGAGSISALSTVSTSGGPGVDITPVTYADGESYQATSGDYIQIYQVDFLVNLALNANTYSFFVGGTPTAENGSLYNPNSVSPFLSASNAALSGSPQEGADGILSEISYDGSGVTGYDTFDSNGDGWDKSSDVNVQLFGTVPEPSSIMLLGIFVCALGLFARKAHEQQS